MKSIRIEPSFAAWRHIARALLQEAVAPHEVEWIEAGESAALLTADGAPAFAEIEAEAGASAAANAGLGANANVEIEAEASTNAEPASAPVAPSAPTISRTLLAKLETAACFRAPDRWAFLYRVLWRWTQGQRSVVSAHDTDGARLAKRIEEVDKELKQMQALLRFRRRDPSLGPPEFVGWFDPRHDVLERAAAHFAKRMGRSSWVIATPYGAAFWDGALLRVDRTTEPEEALTSLSSTGEAATGDAAEALWLAYYESTFNPSYPYEAALPSDLPVRYWKPPADGKPAPPFAVKPLAGAPQTAQAESAVSVPPPAPKSAGDAPASRPPPVSLAACKLCGLWRSKAKPIAGTGPVPAAIMLVGEQPGEQDALSGEPFRGAAGELLDDVLRRAGLERASLYVTNAVKHSKWETLETPRQTAQGQSTLHVHKTPAPNEVEACGYWLDEELKRVQPRAVVALGATALRALTRQPLSLSEYLGQTIAHDGWLIVPTYHPAYALRTRDAKLREEIVATLVAALTRAGHIASQH
ncbi:TIGR03915 family putative DNA repair protein [Trinickia mobilis]|uniref:TIGR03915 family putative DNA repair protein n=1 Tax=Trinickia mobilis TaxID=2816356 RepID=UPI001A8EF44A|nr:TIGR03915 family putative DNA repair protein [Trinickia mobilis]